MSSAEIRAADRHSGCAGCCGAQGFTPVDDGSLMNLVFGTRQRSSSCQREAVGIIFIRATICAHYASLGAKLTEDTFFFFFSFFF